MKIPAPGPFAVEDQREFPHLLKARNERRIAFPHARVALENPENIGIGHPLRAADDAAREVLRDHIALPVKFEQGGKD